MGLKFYKLLCAGLILAFCGLSGCLAKNLQDSSAPTAPAASTGNVVLGPLAFDSVSPTLGDANGNTSLKIKGAGFAAGTVVSVGGVNCPVYLIAGGTILYCTTPAWTGPAGNVPPGTWVDVAVTTPGSATISRPGSFQYTGDKLVPAKVLSVSPAAGALEGGNTITISGTAFRSNPKVFIGYLPCTSVAVQSATSLTCVTPAYYAGLQTVTVQNTDDNFAAKLVDSFNYNSRSTTYADIRNTMITHSKCTTCHGAAGPNQKVFTAADASGYASELAALKTTATSNPNGKTWIAVGNAGNSGLFSRTNNGDMPQGQPGNPLLTPEDQAALNAWITAGAN